MIPNSRPVLAFALLCGVLDHVARAADFVWTGNGDGISFSDPMNWDLLDVPDLDDDVTFLSLGGNLAVDASVETRELIIQNADVALQLSGQDVWAIDRRLRIGTGDGNASLAMTAGTAEVADATLLDDLVIGVALDSIGELHLAFGADLIAPGQSVIGNSGTGLLRIDHGADAFLGQVFVADNATSTASIVVDGDGSTVAIDGELFLGNAGTGQLDIVDGATLIAGAAFLGDDTTASGSILVSGGSLDLTAESFVGNLGSGTIEVSAGGAFTTSRVKVGDETGSDGAVIVAGSASTWSDDVEVIIGNGGAGMMQLLNGATATAPIMSVAENPGSNGDVLVHASELDAGALANGVDGTGSITLRDNATINASSYVQNDVSELIWWIGSSTSDAAITVTGNADVNGTLRINLEPGFRPTEGSTFVLMDAVAIAGTFGTVSIDPALAVGFETDRVVIMVIDGGLPADLDGDGAVDVVDLLIVLSGWGCSECAGDVNGDGMVDLNDLLAVLAAWTT